MADWTEIGAFACAKSRAKCIALSLVKAFCFIPDTRHVVGAAKRV